MNAGKYSFDCYLMPWTIYDLEDKEKESVTVTMDLSDEEICDLVKMMQWAWDNEWFENSTSESVFTELFKKHVPQLYERVYQQAHQLFCSKIPNYKDLYDFGTYEIFPPDEIVDCARNTYSVIVK